jgi:hypothetical protein
MDFRVLNFSTIWIWIWTRVSNFDKDVLLKNNNDWAPWGGNVSIVESHCLANDGILFLEKRIFVFKSLIEFFKQNSWNSNKKNVKLNYGNISICRHYNKFIRKNCDKRTCFKIINYSLGNIKPIMISKNISLFIIFLFKKKANNIFHREIYDKLWPRYDEIFYGNVKGNIVNDSIYLCNIIIITIIMVKNSFLILMFDIWKFNLKIFK